jgi:hypothetical protein
MAGQRRNIVLTDANFQWAAQQAPSEKALSHFINAILQEQRTIGPVAKQLQREADRLDAILTQSERG